ncbi:iron-siderophore ABC transporter substrate-binding protein [Vibrio sp. 10N]|uniref:iron-siderophore ABC transporter substrate-binding protein n=1 Tax=Vibrio sp. 10N TaxID=3058938 RepID=UPI0028144241|nr:iron-siderophore ABC transporter substrate-binding protein [Vibrio sp. 10N]
MKTFWVAIIMLVATSSQAQIPNQVCLATCVSVDKPKLRVVALNWSVAEMLLTLGIEPIGAPQINGYKKWQTNHPAIGDHVLDIGRRQEPSLAAIASLKPDLIVGYQFRHQRLLPQLEQIAPTLLYRQYASSDERSFNYFDQSLRVFKAIAKVTGNSEQGEVIVEALYQTLAKLRQRLQYSQPITYAKFVGMGYGLRVFSDNSLAGQIIRRLGLNYHWTQALPGKDFTHLTIEQLPQLNNSLVLLAGDQANSEYITASPVWKTLPFVRDQHIEPVEPLWSFGGPVSIERMARAFTQAIEAHSHSANLKSVHSPDTHSLDTHSPEGSAEQFSGAEHG